MGFERLPESSSPIRYEFDAYFRIFGSIVIQPPRTHLARLALLHLKNDVAVPRPSMLPVKFTRTRRRIRMRMVPADQIPSFCARLFLREPNILRRNRKAV